MKAALVALGLLGLCLGYREVTSPDLGFHLATARWILENGWVPSKDEFTYTVRDHAYVDLQWLFQLKVHALLKLGGTAAIVVFTTALTLFFGALQLLRTQRRDGRLGAGAVALVLLFFLGSYWEPRPHLFSWIYGALLLLIVEEHRRGRARVLPFIPVVMLLWVNTHSLFVLGGVILGAHVAGHLWERVLREGVAFDKALIGWSFAGLAACLLNPYHVEGLLFPLVQFADIQGSSIYKDPALGISEFRTPFSFDGYTVQGRFVLFQPLLFWQLFTGLAVLGAVVARKQVRTAEWILFAGFLYVFYSANKNFGYFALVAIPPAARGLDRVFAPRRPEASGSRSGWVLAAASVLVALLSVSGRWYDISWSGHRQGTGFNAEFLPVEAADFIVDNGLEGRVLNTWNDGGYLAWRTGQPVTIYSHGEVMGQDFYRAYVAAKGPERFADALAGWKPQIAVVPYASADFWLFQLNQQWDWRLVFRNDRTALFVHDSLQSDLRTVEPLQAGVDTRPFEDAEIEQRVRDVAARPAPGIGAWLRGAAAFPEQALARAAFELQTGGNRAAAALALDALEDTPHGVPDLLLVLGHALNNMRKYTAADVAWNACVRIDDDRTLARSIVAARQAR
jgi:hypothetical protein